MLSVCLGCCRCKQIRQRQDHSASKPRSRRWLSSWHVHGRRCQGPPVTLTWCPTHVPLHLPSHHHQGSSPLHQQQQEGTGHEP
jgi:hypothetical protein